MEELRSTRAVDGRCPTWISGAAGAPVPQLLGAAASPFCGEWP